MARSDMFLKATGQKSGEIVGEASDKSFLKQIDIIDWSWGMSAPSALGGQRTGRVQMQELKLVKAVDKASTALMAVLDHNELLTNVVLTVRKSGGPGAALPYFIVKLQQARINGYTVQSQMGADGSPVLMEHVSLSFQTITIDHTPQSGSGGGTGASSYTGQAILNS